MKSTKKRGLDVVALILMLAAMLLAWRPDAFALEPKRGLALGDPVDDELERERAGDRLPVGVAAGDGSRLARY